MIISGGGSGGGGGGTVTDHFTPRIIVGNALEGDPATAQVPPFQYIQDPGDGSGVEAALAAASAGYDIYIRPGTYTRPATSTIMSIPAGVHVHGEPSGPNGLGGSIIVASVGDATHSQDVFTLGTGASLQDIQIRVPAGANGGQAGAAIVRVPNIACRLSRVYIDMTFGGAGQRNTVFGVGSGSGAASGVGNVFEDCEVLMPSVESTILLYAGFVQGFPGVDSVISTGRGPVYRGCVARGGQAGFAAFNVNAPTYDCCTVDGLILSVFNSVGIFFLVDTSATTPVEGPRIIGPRVFVSATGDGVGSSAAGIVVSNATTNANSIEVRDTVITGYQIVFDPGAGNLVGQRQGIKIRIEDNGTGQMNQGAIGPGVVSGAQIDIVAQTRTVDNTNGVKGSINDFTITGLSGRGFATFGAFVGAGIVLDITNVPARAKVLRTTITGCDVSGAPAATIGVNIAAAGVVNTCVCGNQLTANGGTGIVDSGTGTQTTGNVP